MSATLMAPASDRVAASSDAAQALAFALLTALASCAMAGLALAASLVAPIFARHFFTYSEEADKGFL
ncbi:MAG: hypothetical protein ACO3CJ_09215 [Burkholderiaceae bacterium]